MEIAFHSFVFAITPWTGPEGTAHTFIMRQAQKC